LGTRRIWGCNMINKVKQYGKLFVLIAIAVVVLLIPVMVKSPYYMGLIIVTGVNMALAITFIYLLRVGLLNMAIATFWGIGAYSSYIFVVKMHLSFWLSLPLCAAAAGIVALALGSLLVSHAGFTFVIITAAISMLVPLIIGNTPYLGGYYGIIGIPAPNAIHLPFLPSIEFVSKTQYYYLMLIMLLIIIVIFYAYYHASTGRALTAIGLKPNLAESLGINIYKYRLIAFVLASAVAGLLGCFSAHYVGSLLPNTYSTFKTIYIQIYGILGGIEFAFLGPLIGSLVMSNLPEVMRAVNTFEPIFTGIILIIVILVLPDGILSLPGLRKLTKHSQKSTGRLGELLPSSLTLHKGKKNGDAANK
jgi:branched-chain amino acid transport system permease protein